MENLINAIMGACDYSREEAAQEVQYLINAVKAGEDPEELLYSIGLEPDYVFDLVCLL